MNSLPSQKLLHRRVLPFKLSTQKNVFYYPTTGASTAMRKSEHLYGKGNRRHTASSRISLLVYLISSELLANPKKSSEIYENN